MTEPKDTLISALVKARIACKPTVHKGGFNSSQKYNFVGHEQVLLSGAREALLVHGLVLVETGVSFAGHLDYKTSNGAQLCWRWVGKFLLMHGPSGERLEISVEATTGTNDKSAFVASTALDRTAIMRVLQLAGSASEDPEHDSHDAYRAANERPAKVAKIAETLDSLAEAGAPPPFATAPAAIETTKAPSIDPAEVHKAIIRRDQLVSNYNALAKAARELSNVQLTDELDAYGMMVPPGEPPTFKSGPDAGKSYGMVPAGKLRVLMESQKWRDSIDARGQLYTAYIVATHELSKLEAVK